MKKFVKICALTGLILLLAGIGITSVAAAMGGRFSSVIPHHLWNRIWGDDEEWDDLEYSEGLEIDGSWRHWSEDELWGNEPSAESAADLTESALGLTPPAQAPAKPAPEPGAAKPDPAAKSAPEPGAAKPDPAAKSAPEPGAAKPDPAAKSAPEPGAAKPEPAAQPAQGPGAAKTGPAATEPAQGTADGTGQTLSSFSGTSALDVDIDMGVVRIYEKDGISQIEVNVYDKDNSTRCYMDEDTLKVKRESRRRNAEDARIEILIPAGYQFNKVSADMGAAECQIKGIHTSKLEIDTGVGAVAFDGTVTGDVELETGVGDVTLNLTGRETDYNYKIECGVGTIQVGGSSYTMLSRDTHVNNKALHTMELECGVGTITVSFDEG